MSTNPGPIRWLPLESNPEVMNKFLENLGVPTNWGISDVFSLDDDMLGMIPTPLLALLLLFPTGQADSEFSKLKEEEAKKSSYSPKVYFMKQTIRNACGTVALLHALANNADVLGLKEDSVLSKFIAATKDLSPEERGKQLEGNEDIGIAHECSAQQGQTEAPPLDAEVSLHFIALVNVDDTVYELDGRKTVPVSYGSTSASTFCKDAARVCKEYMQRDPENLNFTILALGPLSQ